MFIFFTILLLMISLYVLIKGNMFNKIILEIDEFEKQNINDISLSKKTTLLLKIISAFIYLIVYLSYLINALKIDIFVYPTFTMLMLFLVSFVINLIKNKKQTNERRIRRLKKERTLKRTVISSIEVVYFLYMLMIAIFY